MRQFLVAPWREIKTWWSPKIGVAGIVVLAAIPAISDQWPNFAPGLLALFPKHGAQWVPIAGAALAVIARVISQAAVIEAFRRLLRRETKEGGDGAA
jgi:peptidoglycan/LPS O-acetylase OafA/YrhL